jgi:hypothetical protein
LFGVAEFLEIVNGDAAGNAVPAGAGYPAPSPRSWPTTPSSGAADLPRGDFGVFVERPINAGLLLAAMLLTILQVVLHIRRGRRAVASGSYQP